MKKSADIAKQDAVQNLLLQLLETELGGVLIYRAALDAVQNDDLEEEWEKYLSETQEHVRIAERVLQACGVDPDTEAPARKVVRTIGRALEKNIRDAIAAGDPVAAEIVAAEAIVEAETKDHLNWELLGHVAKRLTGEAARVVREAIAQVEPQEDHHLYHTKGWARELWLAAFGLPAALPPPEEVKNVETAIGAARAEKARSTMARPHPKH
jgi:ferritin-like metal-binding protein YciE